MSPSVNGEMSGISAEAREIIRYHAGRLIGQYGLTNSDRADLEQEMTCDLLRRLRKFDPERAKRGTFISRIVKHQVTAIIRYRTRKMRDYRRNGCSLAELPPEHPSLTTTDRGELAADLATVLAKLPREMRNLCERLRDEPVPEIARRTGMSQARVNKMLGELRRRFEEAGLREYL
jgi:RNA polymerase sigma factor (sigma-70 family)